jgi:hypothetical protein
MIRMKLFLVLFLICLGGSFAMAAEANNDALGFRSWKAQRIQEAQRNYFELYTESQKNPNSQENAKKDQLAQAKTNIQVARELDMENYYALYFKKLSDNKEAFVKVIKQMSPEEVAELLMLYQKSLSRVEQELSSRSPVVSGLGITSDPNSSL